MRTDSDVEPGEHYFELKLVYDNGFSAKTEKDFSFSVSVNSGKSDIGISNLKIGEGRIYLGKDFLLNIDLENSGDREAKNIKSTLVGFEDFVGVKIDYIGTLDVDEILPSRYYLSAPILPGIYEGKLVVEYKEAGGEKTIEFPVQLQVSKNREKILGAVVLGVVIFVFGLLFWHYRKVRVAKGAKKDEAKSKG